MFSVSIAIQFNTANLLALIANFIFIFPYENKMPQNPNVISHRRRDGWENIDPLAVFKDQRCFNRRILNELDRLMRRQNAYFDRG